MGQHRSEDIPKLLKPILDGSADFAIGSRFVEGGAALTCQHTVDLESK